MQLIRIALVAFVLGATNASATIVEYFVTNISGNIWEYQYSVSNSAGAEPIEEFTIYFALGLYDDLNVAASPASWDSIVIEPDPAIPAAGFFDSVALASGIGPSESLDGFVVRFSFLGTGTPGGQPFDIVGSDFKPIFSGVTASAISNGIPEPSTLCLIGVVVLLTVLRISVIQYRTSFKYVG